MSGLAEVSAECDVIVDLRLQIIEGIKFFLGSDIL